MINEFDTILSLGTLLVSGGLFLTSLLLITEKYTKSFVAIGFLLLDTSIDYLIHSGILNLGWWVIIPDSITLLYLILIIVYLLKRRNILSKFNDSSSSTDTVI